MKFDEAVDNVSNITDLRRFASAHVVDYRNLKEKELKNAIKKVKPQYLHPEIVSNSIEQSFYGENDLTKRVLSKIIINIILEAVGFALPSDVLEEQVIAFEQKIIDKSNEVDLSDLAGGKKNENFKNLQLYNFVLTVAWEHRNTKSPDEANLLRRLRNRLGITEYEHRILETKLGKFPKVDNELHNRTEISTIRRFLQTMGLLITIKNDNKKYYDIIPEELGIIIRKVLGKEIRTEGYKLLLSHKYFRKKSMLQKSLKKSGYNGSVEDTKNNLIEKIIRRIKPSDMLNALNNDELYKMCSELKIPVSGTKEARIERIIDYFDKLQIKTKNDKDPREIYFEHFVELAFRDRELLRAKGIIDKDLEIEHYFEKATCYIFEVMLNRTPLNQPGSNRPDGLISFNDMYLMWDNKSKEKPGYVNLKDHIKQFDGYMNNSDKPVPIFLVIAPNFTPESEFLAVQYSAEHIGRSIVLITAAELKELAEKWSNEKNKHKDEPFPLGLFANSGRFNKKIIDQLI